MTNTPLIGRIEERKILEKALQSPKAEMVSVIGRRRVGKTFLVKSAYEGRIDFEITGIQNATRQEQLRNFMIQLSGFSKGSFPQTQPKDLKASASNTFRKLKKHWVFPEFIQRPLPFTKKETRRKKACKSTF